MGILRFHSYTSRTRATRVIEACRLYEAKHGKLPDRLADLVPEQLESVPRAKYTLVFGEFTYWASGTHTLLYVALPPSGRRLYHFEEDRWSTMD